MPAPPVMMPVRIRGVFEAVEGFKRSGTFLVSWNGETFLPSGPTDDKGLYLFAQVLYSLAKIDPVHIPGIFWMFFFWLPFFSSLLSFYFMLRTLRARIVAYLYLLLIFSALAKKVGDVYIIPASAALTLIPPFLVLIRRRSSNLLLAFGFIAGIAAGLFDLFRVYAGTGALFFFIVFMTLRVIRKRMEPKKFLIVMAMIAGGYFIYQGALTLTLAKRDAFLARFPEAQPYLSQLKHHFWHNFYIGFGFLSNPYIPGYRDEIAISKAREVDPQVKVATPKYNAILRSLTLKFIRNNLFFSLKTLFAKLGVVSFFILVFMNFSVLVMPVRINPIELDVAFFITAIFYAAYGLVAIPMLYYIAGTVACAAIYAAVTWGLLLERKGLFEIFSELIKKVKAYFEAWGERDF